MKVIDLLNKIATHESLPKKIKCRGDIYTLYIDENFINYEPECGDWLFNQYLYKLNDEIEIIEEPKEEPKEELEEIDLLKKLCHQVVGVYDNDTNRIVKDFNKQIKQISENINSNVEIINNFMANQNKIIRELKANNNK